MPQSADRRERGRPRLNDEERQDRQVLIRLRPGEVERLQELAERAGTTVARYVRDLVRRHLSRSRRS